MVVSSHTLRFLGTAAYCGVPSFYCGCKACEEALRNPAAQRTCSALLIRGRQNTLIDAGPDLRMQLSLARASDIHQVLLTHEHADHIGGIAQMEFYVRFRLDQPLPIYAPAYTLEAVSQQFGFMRDTLELHELKAWQTIEFDGLRYTALPASHGVQTFGYLIEQGTDLADSAGSGSISKRVAYFPDTGPPASAVAEAIRGVDYFIIDASFNGRNQKPEAHLSIDEAIQLSIELEAKKTFLTHLTMHYDEPITTYELQQYLSPYAGSILAANDGLELRL